MPTEISTPAPVAAVERLTLGSEAVRGAEQALTIACSLACTCMADDVK